MESNDIYEQNQEYIDTIAELGRDKERLQKQLDIALKIIDAVMQDEYTMETMDGGLSMYLYTGLEKIEELNK